MMIMILPNPPYVTLTSLQVSSLTSHIEKLQALLAMSDAVPTAEDGNNLVKENMDFQNQVMVDLLTAFSPELSLEDVLERMVKVIQTEFKPLSIGLWEVEEDNESPTMVLRVSKEKRGLRRPLSGLLEACCSGAGIVNLADAHAGRTSGTSLTTPSAHHFATAQPCHPTTPPPHHPTTPPPQPTTTPLPQTLTTTA